jgi:hypothetical protein
MYFTLTLGIGTLLCFSDCSEIARFVASETIAAHTSHYHTERYLLSAGNCFDDEGANGTGGVAGPPVDLTMMSGVEKPSKNRNAANHQMVDPSNTHCSPIWLFSPVAFCEYAAFCMT